MKTKTRRIILSITALFVSVSTSYIGMVFLIKPELDSWLRFLCTISFLGWPVCVILIIITMIKYKPESETSGRLKIWKITLSIISTIFALLSAILGLTISGLDPYVEVLYQIPYIFNSSLDSSMIRMLFNKDSK